MQSDPQPLSATDYINNIKHLPASELEKVFEHILRIRANSKASNLDHQESNLLLKINKAIPQELQQRFDQLAQQKRESSLSATEYNEYLELIDKIEQLDVERLGNLVELAKIRQIPLRQLMQDLGIKQPAYA